MSKGFGYVYSGTAGHIIGVASSLPSSPSSLLKKGWIDITHPDAKKAGHLELQETSTGLKIRFDKKTPGAKGYKGKNHYHIYNPNATSNKDLYLNSKGNPVAKNSSESHILPGGKK